MIAFVFYTSCWTWTGQRQTQKYREKYINAILSQEIGWFDSVGAGQLSTKVADLCGLLQDGITEKAANMIQVRLGKTSGFILLECPLA